MDDLPEPVIEQLREREGTLIKIIESLNELEQSEAWRVLKEFVFDKAIVSIERQMLDECLAPEIKVEKIYKLQGEWVWAKQYSDPKRFAGQLQLQLEGIKKQLKNK